MIHADAKLVEALDRLGRNSDFLAFLEWLTASREAEMTALLTVGEDRELHRHRGAVLALDEVLTLARGAEQLHEAQRTGNTAPAAPGSG